MNKINTLIYKLNIKAWCRRFKIKSCTFVYPANNNLSVDLIIANVRFYKLQMNFIRGTTSFLLTEVNIETRLNTMNLNKYETSFGL